MSRNGGGERGHLFDRPENVRRLLRGFYAVCGVLFVLDFVLHRHVEHPAEAVPVFYPLYGFVACVALVLVAKQMRRVLMRREDYYGEPPGDGTPDAPIRDDTGEGR